MSLSGVNWSSDTLPQLLNAIFDLGSQVRRRSFCLARFDPHDIVLFKFCASIPVSEFMSSQKSGWILNLSIGWSL